MENSEVIVGYFLRWGAELKYGKINTFQFHFESSLFFQI